MPGKTPPFRIYLDDSRVRTWILRIPRNLRKRAKIGLDEFGSHLVDRLLQQARTVGLKQFRSSRSMFTDTKYVSTENGGYISMPKSGMFQDRARAHYVPVSKSKPMLWAWAKRYGFTGRGFMFQKKPFIRQGVSNALTRLMPIMRPQVRAAIRESHP